MTVLAKSDANDAMLATSTTDSLLEQPHNDNRTDNIQQCPQIKGKQSQLRYMNACVINCCSIRNKLTYVLDHVKDHKSDIVAITESWLSSDEGNNCTVSQECADHDYKLWHIPPLPKIMSIKAHFEQYFSQIF